MFRGTILSTLFIRNGYIRCLHRCDRGLFSISILIYAGRGILLLFVYHLDRWLIGSLGLLFSCSCRRSLFLLAIALNLTKVEHLRELRVALTLTLGAFPVVVKLGRLAKACLLLLIIIISITAIVHNVPGIVGLESFDPQKRRFSYA